MSDDQATLNDKLEELFCQFKDIISEIKGRNSEIAEMRAENERLKTLYFASESRPPSEIRRPANIPVITDYTNLSFDGVGFLSDNGVLKNSTKINREIIVQEAKQKAELRKTAENLAKRLKIETGAFEKMDNQLARTSDKIQRAKESYEILSSLNRQLYPRIEKKRQIEERLNSFAEENEKLAKILQLMLPTAQKKASKLTKAEHDELIKRFHRERKELMAQRVWDKSLGKVFTPSQEILQAQQAYLDALKNSLNH